MDQAASTILTSTISSIMVESGQSIIEYPADDEEIDDESTDSEIEKRNVTKMRLQSIYDRQSAMDSMCELSPESDGCKYRFCVVCEKPITDLVIWALNKPHHCRCLICFVCKEQIGFRKFKVIEGEMLMCYKDYYESYQRCRICQKPFEGQSSRSYTKLYHKRCFKCINCFDPVTSDGAVELFDETYCATCAESIVIKKNILQEYYENLNRVSKHLKQPEARSEPEPYLKPEPVLVPEPNSKPALEPKDG